MCETLKNQRESWNFSRKHSEFHKLSKGFPGISAELSVKLGLIMLINNQKKLRIFWARMKSYGSHPTALFSVN
ncbi:MAG: hypothetical protein KAR56_04600, partial [Thermoplasmata archaeon]|nr:hypothetical protein [Thermoplasmata archaeon]